MRARLALMSSGQKVALREVKLANKPANMLEASPKGTVPVLVLVDGGVVDESLDVMHWALSITDPDHWLAGDASKRDALIQRCDEHFKHHLDRTKYHTRYEGADPDHHRSEAMVFIHALEEQLTDAPYLFGERITLADAAILPFIRQFANIDRATFDAAPCPHVQKWLEKFLTSDLFQSIMSKYAPWVEGDDPLVFGA